MKKLIIILILIFSVNAWTTTIDVPLTNTNEDAIRYLNTINIDVTGIFGADVIIAGNGTGVGAIDVTVRFDLSASKIPAASTITAAYITFNSAGSTEETTAAVNVSAEKNASPSAWSDGDDTVFLTRYGNKTTAVVAWNGATFSSGKPVNSPDLSTIIQEVVNSQGELSGINFFLMDNGSSSNVNYTFWGVNMGAPATLHVEYTTGGTTATVHYLSWRVL